MTTMRRAAVLALALLAGCRGEPGDIEATGTLEVVEVDAAPLQAARVVQVLADEGDTVRAGDTLATLTQALVVGDVGQREAHVAAAEARLREAQAGPRAAQIRAAEAELRAREAEAARLARDAERYQALLEGGALSRQAYDQARTAARVAASQRDAAAEAVRLLRQGTRAEEVEVARAEVAGARSALEAARGTRAELTLVAAVGGTVLGRWAEPGEVVAPGQAVLTVGETVRPWTRVYVGQDVLPTLRIGQAVEARLDAFPDSSFGGRIVAVNDRAEFTPRVALTEDEREDLLFGVKVELAASPALKPGLPVTVVFRRPGARR